MSNSVASVFARGIFEGGTGSTAAKEKAIGGFSEIFGALMAKEMRTAMLDNTDPNLMGDSASSGIVGGFFDQAIGAALAHSKAMQPLNRMLDRELGGVIGRSTGPHLALGDGHRVGNGTDRDGASENTSQMAAAQNRTDASLLSSTEGPILLPPRPSLMAPLLPPPSSLKM